MTLNVGIYVFDEAEVMDFAGPYEVFSTASRAHQRLHPEAERLVEVFLIGEAETSYLTRGGLRVLPPCSIKTHPDIDILVIPGGVISDQVNKADVVAWVRQQAARSQITASVCTGAFILAAAGLLDGLHVTTHWEDIDDLKKSFPQLNVQGSVRYIDSGRVITSAGVSAGIDMSLHIVSRVFGEQLAYKTARQMEYTWIKQ